MFVHIIFLCDNRSNILSENQWKVLNFLGVLLITETTEQNNVFGTIIAKSS